MRGSESWICIQIHIRDSDQENNFKIYIWYTNPDPASEKLLTEFRIQINRYSNFSQDLNSQIHIYNTQTQKLNKSYLYTDDDDDEQCQSSKMRLPQNIYWDWQRFLMAYYDVEKDNVLILKLIFNFRPFPPPFLYCYRLTKNTSKLLLRFFYFY